MGDLTGSVAEGKKKAKLTLSMEKISCGRATGGGSRPWEETQERGLTGCWPLGWPKADLWEDNPCPEGSFLQS